MRQDIISRTDIEFFVDHFYTKAKQDTLIGFIFTELIPIDWEIHIPLICDFWETMIFNNGKYTRNPLMVHMKINEKTPLQPEHFERWLVLFNNTIDQHFEGKNAMLIKTRALSMANVMQIKIHQNKSN